MADLRLRTVDELKVAVEWQYNQQRQGKLDAKSSDAMNTTLKNQIKLVVDLPMKMIDQMIKAQIKKIDIPPLMLPDGTRPKA